MNKTRKKIIDDITKLLRNNSKHYDDCNNWKAVAHDFISIIRGDNEIP
jgi:hypothetical protein